MKYFKSILIIKFFFMISSIGTLQAATPDNSQNFLVITDIHLDKTSRFSMNFAPTQTNVLNDLDERTFHKILKKTQQSIQQQKVPRPKFILLLGDLPGHLRLLPTLPAKNEKVVFQLLLKYFPKTPIFYVFGNNDSLTTKYGLFETQNNSPFKIAVTQAHWKNGFLSTGSQCNFLNYHYPCLIDQNTQQGYYAAYIEPKLRLIALNSVMFSVRHQNDDTNAPEQQLQWLNNELEQAKINHEKVLLAMHIPPGKDVFNHSFFWSNASYEAFLNLMQKYHRSIMAILTAHTHREDIQIIQNNQHQNLIGVYATPALSTAYGNSPAIKTYFYGQEEGYWSLKNYVTFYFSKENDTVQLNKLYDFRNYYCTKKNHKILSCLNNVTVSKLKKYYTAGNTKFTAEMKKPEDLYIILRQVYSNQEVLNAKSS